MERKYTAIVRKRILRQLKFTNEEIKKLLVS